MNTTRIPYSSLPDAGLFRRLAALVYDGLLILALWFTSVGVAVILHGNEAIDARLMQWVGLPALWLETALFYGWFWLHGGQTLGMRAWRLQLTGVDARGEARAVTVRDCAVRSLVGTLSVGVALLGMLWVIVNGRTWHDSASRTRVVVLPKDAKR